MSYILDALKRAEQQRGDAARATARAPLATTFEEATRGWGRWIAGGVVGVGALLAAITLWPTTPPPLTPGPPRNDVVAVPGPTALPTPAPPPTVAPQARVTPPPERNVPGRVARPPVDRDVGTRTAVAPETLSTPTPRPSESVAPARPVRPAPAPEVWSIPRRDDAPIATRRPPRADDVAPAVRPAPGDARVATPSAPDVASPAPSRPAAPGAAAGTGGGDLKALTAKISLQVLTWSPEPKDRFVFLNGRRYAEGQLVDDKLLVERITEDGVVLSYRGERVTLKGR